MLNYDKKLVKLKTILNNWSKRYLTPIGKITVVKSLLISQFNHFFISLPNPSENFMKTLNNILFNFVWNNKPDKIKREIIIKNYEEGGLKMLHLKSFISALKLSWIRKILRGECKSLKILEKEINIIYLLNCGKEYTRKCFHNIKNLFWKDVLLSFEELQTKYKNDSSEYFLKTPLFHNSCLKIGGVPIFYKRWFLKGIYYINDLYNKDGIPMTYNEFIGMLDIKTNFLEFQGIQ